ncbi:hypothetical protein FRC08_018410 [Ceratobasidium sp. 394]|nr:hypothetical protein FRC08_018410 [Ceratobasidium sp. 394]
MPLSQLPHATCGYVTGQVCQCQRLFLVCANARMATVLVIAGISGTVRIFDSSTLHLTAPTPQRCSNNAGTPNPILLQQLYAIVFANVDPHFA